MIWEFSRAFQVRKVKGIIEVAVIITYDFELVIIFDVVISIYTIGCTCYVYGTSLHYLCSVRYGSACSYQGSMHAT